MAVQTVQRIERGDLWKSRALMLQIRLRERLRVAVGRHCHRPTIFSSDGHFSSTLRRWLRRFRDFRRDSLPSSAVFYRKRVSKDFLAEEDSVILRMLQAMALPVLGNMCHVFMHGLNHVQVFGIEKLHDALLHRPKNKPLITVSNHVASVDDPFIIASLLPPRVLLDAQSLRWTLCATDRCFKNPVTSAFFRTVRVLPLSRGDGIYQKGMDMSISKLNSGGWVHVFPEGTRSRDGGKTMGSSRRGVGRLVLDADILPVVIPFVHTGMQEVMPIGASLPRIGKTVTVVVGDPIHFDDLLNAEGVKYLPREKLYDAVASRVGHRLQELKALVEKLAIEHSIAFFSNKEQADDILQQVDWDSFGIGSHVSVEGGASMQEFHVQTNMNYTPPQQPQASDKTFRMGSSYEGGIMSRIRRYRDPTELMGFAARGLFVNSRAKERPVRVVEVAPLRTWKQISEAMEHLLATNTIHH